MKNKKNIIELNYILIKNRRKILGAVCIKVAGGGVL